MVLYFDLDEDFVVVVFISEETFFFFFFFLFKDVEKKNGAKEPQTPHP